jgi:hypothetical protein
MPKDLAIGGWEQHPDLPALVGEALGAAGVNIEGTFGSFELGLVHVLVEDPAAARRALERAGLAVIAESDVILRSMRVVDQPGSWGRLARRLANAGVEIRFHYLASQTRVVIGVDDQARAVRALQVLGG